MVLLKLERATDVVLTQDSREAPSNSSCLDSVTYFCQRQLRMETKALVIPPSHPK